MNISRTRLRSAVVIPTVVAGLVVSALAGGIAAAAPVGSTAPASSAAAPAAPDAEGGSAFGFLFYVYPDPQPLCPLAVGAQRARPTRRSTAAPACSSTSPRPEPPARSRPTCTPRARPTRSSTGDRGRPGHRPRHVPGLDRSPTRPGPPARSGWSSRTRSVPSASSSFFHNAAGRHRDRRGAPRPRRRLHGDRHDRASTAARTLRQRQGRARDLHGPSSPSPTAPCCSRSPGRPRPPTAPSPYTVPAGTTTPIVVRHRDQLPDHPRRSRSSTRPTPTPTPIPPPATGAWASQGRGDDLARSS